MMDGADGSAESPSVMRDTKETHSKHHGISVDSRISQGWETNYFLNS